MATDHIEVEDKYDVDDGTVLPELETLPGVAHWAVPVEHELEATYFDTPELTLAHAGITIRRRSGGDDPGWHLKLPETGARRELRVPLGRSTRTVPKPLRTVVTALVRDQPLSPVATLRTRRTVHRLLDSDGGVLAEVSDDRVSATDSNTATARTWREWEVELVDGDAALLGAARTLFLDSGASPSRSPSKLARALDGRISTPSGGLSPVPRRRSAAGKVVQNRLAQQVDLLRRLDPLVRRDVPDAVHRMRVAIRRLRSALATFRPLMEREVTEPLREDLRWLAGALAGARDAEVMRERLRQLVAAERPVVVRGAVLTRIDRELREERKEERARAVAAMESERYFSLLDHLEAMAANPPWTKAAGERTGDVLPRRVLHDWKRLEGHVAELDKVSDPSGHARQLHEVRKAARRVRYAAEPLAPIYGKDAKRFIKATKQIQSVLGEHHDSVVTQERLRGLADRATAACDNAFTFGVLHVREEAAASDAEQRFAKTWSTASRKKLRRWLT